MACQRLCNKVGMSEGQSPIIFLHYSCTLKMQGWCFVYLPSLSHHPYLVCILFGMSSLRLKLSYRKLFSVVQLTNLICWSDSSTPNNELYWRCLSNAVVLNSWQKGGALSLWSNRPFPLTSTSRIRDVTSGVPRSSQLQRALALERLCEVGGTGARGHIKRRWTGWT